MSSFLLSSVFRSFIRKSHCEPALAKHLWPMAPTQVFLGLEWGTIPDNLKIVVFTTFDNLCIAFCRDHAGCQAPASKFPCNFLI